MNPIDELAQSLSCLESTDGNTFQRKARVLQALWRVEEGYPIGHHRGREIGSCLAMPWAEETLANFLDDDIRDVVTEVLHHHSGPDRRVIERRRLFSNLLSSQPLAFNLFAHLKLDTALATRAFSALTEGRIANVTAVEFEFSPGRGDDRYTGDNSAFDVYIKFDTPAGLPGFAGVEVKYHENLEDKPARHRARYDEVARQMGIFTRESYPSLRLAPLQQIWRDHLLCGAHRTADAFSDGLFIFLNPQGNDACNRAVSAYSRGLTAVDTFVHLTLEDLVSTLHTFTKSAWLDRFADRYTNFAKIDRTLGL